MRTRAALAVACLFPIGWAVYSVVGPRPLPMMTRWVGTAIGFIPLVVAGYAFWHCEEFSSRARDLSARRELRLLAFLCLFTTVLLMLETSMTLLFPVAILAIPAFGASVVLLINPTRLQRATIFRNYMKVILIGPLALSALYWVMEWTRTFRE